MKDILIDGKQYPLFCGGEDEHVDDFTCNLEMCFKLDKVKYWQKIELFTRVLRGSAQDWFEGLPTSRKVSWRDVVEAFCMHFGVKISPWVFRFKDIVFEKEQDSYERSMISHDEENIVVHAMMYQHTVEMECIQEKEAFMEPQGDSWHDTCDESSVYQDLCELMDNHDIQGIQGKGHLHEESLNNAHLKVKEEAEDEVLVDDRCCNCMAEIEHGCESQWARGDKEVELDQQVVGLLGGIYVTSVMDVVRKRHVKESHDCWNDVDIFSIYISTWCGSRNHDKHIFDRLGYDGIRDRSSWMLSCTQFGQSHGFGDEQLFPFDPGGLLL